MRDVCASARSGRQRISEAIMNSFIDKGSNSLMILARIRVYTLGARTSRPHRAERREATSNHNQEPGQLILHAAPSVRTRLPRSQRKGTLIMNVRKPTGGKLGISSFHISKFFRHLFLQ